MEHATYVPITLAIIGLALVTLAASKATVNDRQPAEPRFQHLNTSHNNVVN